MRFKKGSKEAKAYMAKIRGAKGAIKKVASEKQLIQKGKMLQADLKVKKLRLPGGYKVIKRISGLLDDNFKIEKKGYGHYKISIKYYGKIISCITTNTLAVDDFNSDDGSVRIVKGYKALRKEVIKKNK